MHDALLRELRFEHGTPPQTSGNERRTWAVVALTAATMVVEITVGWWTGSQALTADGWHMGTHAGAIGLAGLAYWFARTQANRIRFSFGTGKVYALAGWTNATVLLLAAGMVGLESVEHLVAPEPVHFAEALPVAVIGLLVNLASVFLLGGHSHGGHDHGGHGHAHGGHDHAHGDHGHAHGDHGHAHGDHGHAHGEHGHAHGDHGHAASDEEHHDLNLRSAYLHVLMDLLTSVAAIAALATGEYFGWTLLDPLVGLIGGLVIGTWAVSLLRDSGYQLLDMAPSDDTIPRLRARLESIDDVQVVDLHVWSLGFGRRACMLSLVTDTPRPHAEYRAAVREISRADHLTIEIHSCPAPCREAAHAHGGGG